MAASALILIAILSLFGRYACYAHQMCNARSAELGAIILKLAPNCRAAFTNWLWFKPNASIAGGTRLVLQEAQL